MSRRLLLSVSAGAGHVRAAEALRVAGMQSAAQALHLDAVGYEPRAFCPMTACDLIVTKPGT